MSDPVRAVGLSKHFRGVRALEGLDLEVPEGAVFALVGANGAGKTTALKTLMSIHGPTAGHAFVLGCNSRRLGPPEFARIGYVSENQELPLWMRTGEYLEFCRPFYPRWDAAPLLELFRLPLDRKLGELSRGMRMKAALVSSLAYHPELIVLDEPFSGLDAVVRDELIEGLLERTEKATVLISSHDLGEVETFATHVGFLDKGRLHFAEELDTLVARFRDVTVTLAGPAAPPASGAVPPAWLHLRQEGCVVRFVDSRWDTSATGQHLHAAFPGIRAIDAAPMPLRAIFVALARESHGDESA